MIAVSVIVAQYIYSKFIMHFWYSQLHLIAVLFVMSHVSVTTAGFARTSEVKKWILTACPVEMAVYSCYFQGMTARAKHLEKFTIHNDITSTASRGDNSIIKNNQTSAVLLSPQALVQLIGSKTILMYGDSMMLQTFIAFVCRIHGAKGIISQFNIQWQFRHWLGYQNCPYRNSKHCELRSGSCVVFQTTTDIDTSTDTILRVCFVWHDGKETRVPLLTAARGFNMTRNDLMIASIGTWFFQGDVVEASKNFTSAVLDIVNQVKEHKLESNFMWLEASPQHFGNERPEVQGYFNQLLAGTEGEYFNRVNRGISSKSVSKSGRGGMGVDPKQHSAAISTTHLCIPLAHRNHEVALQSDPRNRIPETLLPDTVPIIRTWSYLAELSHAHVAMRNIGGGAYALDCSHWCLPGPLVEIFPYAFVKAYKPFNIQSANDI